MDTTNNSNRTILLIDDDSIANLISTKVIEMTSNFNVISITHSSQALESLRQWSTISDVTFPEIIFLDVNMPVMNGWEFLY